MQIRRSGILGQLFLLSGNKTKEVNLCELPWRGLGGIFLLLLLGIIYLIAGTIYACWWVVLFMVAKRPDGIFNPSSSEEYSRWPTVKGFRVLPGVVIGFAYLAWIIAKIASNQALNKFEYSAMALVAAAVMLVCLSFIIDWTVNLYNNWKRTEVWKIVKLWVSAKKQKVCPKIEIVD